MVHNNGTGIWSVHTGAYFPDEDTDFLFSRPGLLAMANHNLKPHTNGCQFFITLTETEYLNRKSVVFGEVSATAGERLGFALSSRPWIGQRSTGRQRQGPLDAAPLAG